MWFAFFLSALSMLLIYLISRPPPPPCVSAGESCKGSSECCADAPICSSNTLKCQPKPEKQWMKSGTACIIPANMDQPYDTTSLQSAQDKCSADEKCDGISFNPNNNMTFKCLYPLNQSNQSFDPGTEFYYKINSKM